MCGIYGYIGKPEDRSKVMELVEHLAVETEVRGIHATGYYGLNNEVITDKLPLKASEFIKTDNFKKLYEHIPTIFIGHNRWASCGDPKDNRNNHPFTTGRFGFIHNGVITEKFGLKDITNQLNISLTSDCDSELIFKYFTKRFYNDHNHFNSLEKVMKFFDKNGDYACAMIDTKDRHLYLFRNSGRPIVWIYLENLNIMVFASTEEILKTSLDKSNISFNKTKINSVKMGKIMRINENLKIAQYQVEGLTKPVSYTTYKVPFKVPARLTACSNVKTPKKFKSKSGYECQICKKIFVSAYYAKKHIEKHHKILELEKIEKNIKNLSYPNDKISFTTTVGDKIIQSGTVIRNSLEDTVSTKLTEDKDEQSEFKIVYKWGNY